MAPAKAKCVRPAAKPRAPPPDDEGRTALTPLRDHPFAARRSINLVKLALSPSRPRIEAEESGNEILPSSSGCPGSAVNLGAKGRCSSTAEGTSRPSPEP